MSWCGRLQNEVDILQAPKDCTEKSEVDGGAGTSWVPGVGEMPCILARSGQWPVPGTSTTWDTRRGSGLHQKESTDYDQTVSERAYGKHSVLAQVHLVRRQQSHHGTASPPQNQREGIREWKGGKEKAKIRMYYEVGHYLG